MKKLILAAMALLAFIGASSAIVALDCPPNVMCMSPGGGEPVSNISFNSNQSIEDPRVEITQVGASCFSNQNNIVHWGDYHKRESYPPQHRIEFNGTLITPDPCQELDYNISKKGGIYTLNIYAEPKEGNCIQCLGAVNYRATFSATAEHFQLNVQHDGKDMSSFAPPQKINEGGLVNHTENNPLEKPTKTGFMARILGFLTGFF